MKWVTRERPKIDRIACPWLVRRFVEPDAEFLYVPTERVFEVAKETGATPYDIPSADTARHDLAPKASGLHAISMGLSANIPDDHAMLEQGMVIYDALYAWCRGAAGEIHNWTPAKGPRTAAPEGVP